jgi:MFS family permease
MRTRSPLLPIFLIVLVDVLGLTIVLPLLAHYAETFGASPLTATLISSCYAACSLVSSPVLGRLSDRYGRRPLLLVSQGGTFIGFIILANANALWLVFVGRILDGITAGNLSLAQAYISDHTAPENRTKAFGIIGIAFGIGFMFGPVASSLLFGLSPSAPFFFAAGLSALSIFCTYTILPRELPPKVDADPAAGPPPPAGRRPGIFDFSVYADYFKRPGFASLLAQFFLYQFAFSLFTQNFVLFAERRFTVDGHPWGPHEVGWIFAYSGLLGIILQGGILGRLVKKFGEAPLIVVGFLATVIAYLVLGVTETVAVLLIASTISAFGNGVLRPALTSRITQAVGRHEQGVALGISQSLGSIAMTLAPPTGGFLIGHGWLTAWAVVAAVVSALGLGVAMALRKPAAPAPTT